MLLIQCCCCVLGAAAAVVDQCWAGWLLLAAVAMLLLMPLLMLQAGCWELLARVLHAALELHAACPVPSAAPGCCCWAVTASHV